ncbi:hypothetical protein [Confluentibacter sediminis]|uniref:hypothetical protein n=1 Tax=Confluentibacter sediminis TaxID=2219045 RepID=UPI000DAC88FA|nr:hypothetical protein [Confluentibacter sediminis]
MTLQTKKLHYDVDVAHKINTMELLNWINHLKYITKELGHIISVYNEALNDRGYHKNMVRRFQKKQRENENLLKALLEYSDSRSHIWACEDASRDMTYIAAHDKYRRSYLYHLHKYGRLKEEFFNKAQNKFAILRIE